MLVFKTKMFAVTEKLLLNKRIHFDRVTSARKQSGRKKFLSMTDQTSSENVWERFMWNILHVVLV